MWYAPLEPHRSGLLDVGGGHRLYWEMSGNSHGRPALVLHGGPGGRSTPNDRRWFDPRLYCIIAFDQRGCGRSTPYASIDSNTLGHLIDDVEALRVALEVKRWILLGRSWGATLAIAYTQRYSNRVDALILSGVFTARQRELDWLYPSALIRTHHTLAACGDPAAALEAARAWCDREDSRVSSIPRRQIFDDRLAVARATIGTHYFMNRCFLREGELLANAHRLNGIPGVIVQGQNDAVTPPMTACELHDAWAGSTLQIIPDAGHASTEPGIMRALIAATDRWAAAEPL